MARELLDLEGFRAWLKSKGDRRVRGSFALGCEIIARYLREIESDVSVGNERFRVGERRDYLPRWAEIFIAEVYGSRHLTGSQALKILDSV